jgi:hypothetical protein
MTNTNKVDYTKQDLIEYYKDKILLDWVKNNHPEIIEKAEEFINNNIKYE